MPPPPQPESQADHTANGIHPGDSGYHGTTEDEMEVDGDDSVVRLSPRKETPAKPMVSSSPKPNESHSKSASASFVSAKEDLENQTQSRITIHEDEDEDDDDEEDEDEDEDEGDQGTMHEDDMELVATQPDESPIAQENAQPRSPQYSVGDQTASALNSVMNAAEDQQEDVDEDGARTPSDGSSPAKPLLRKSSLTFSSLPAREPLAGKKSMGNRTSRTSHLDQYKARSSHFGRFTGGKSLGGSQAVPYTQDDEEMADSDREDESPKMHNKTSTQRLHERINMLAQSQESRTSKSIPGPASQEPNYPQLPTEKDGSTQEAEAPVAPPKAPSPVRNNYDEYDDDDDWIAPITTKPPPALARPALRKSISTDVMENISGKNNIGGLDADVEGKSRSEMATPLRLAMSHMKSGSVPNFESPAKAAAKQAEKSHKKANSISDPEALQDAESSTPVGSPRRNDDAPLSASKSKFFSVLKSAKSIFASSAGVSAQAKLEALSPSSSAKSRDKSPAMEQVSTPPRQTLSSVFDKPVNPASPARRPATAIGTPSQTTEVRKTRASFERERQEQEMEAQNEREEALQKAREQEEQKAAEKEKQETKPIKQIPGTRFGAVSRTETVSSPDDDYNSADDAPQPAPSKPERGPPKMREPKSRLVKPSSKENLPKPRTHIKVGLGSQRPHPTNVDLSKSLHGTLPASSKAADPVGSSFNKSIGPAGAKQVSSLEKAAKNKEREEREAQRKAEKKRAIEQQRAAKAAKAEEERRKADDERRAEAQRKAAEQQRAQELKRAASRQALAAEAKKQEQMRAQASNKQPVDLVSCHFLVRCAAFLTLRRPMHSPRRRQQPCMVILVAIWQVLDRFRE